MCMATTHLMMRIYANLSTRAVNRVSNGFKLVYLITVLRATHCDHHIITQLFASQDTKRILVYKN